MDELKADAEAEGFSCIELTTDGRSVFEIIQSVLNVHLLIGVNSAAYNAIFMPIPAAVLEIDAKLGGYYTGAHSSGPQSFLTTHIGYHWLGIHLFLYSIGRRLATGNDPTIAVSVNVTQTALSAMRQKVQQQEAIGCCEVTALDREECRGTWQYVHREHVYLDITNKYNATSVASPWPRAARRIYLDMGANWANTLRLYEELLQPSDVLPSDGRWLVFAFEASPLIAPYVEKFTDFLNGRRAEQPHTCLPTSGSSIHLSEYALAYGCAQFIDYSLDLSNSDWLRCVFERLDRPLRQLVDEMDPKLNSSSLLREPLYGATTFDDSTTRHGDAQFVFVPAAVGVEDGTWLDMYNNPRQLIWSADLFFLNISEYADGERRRF